MRGKTISSSALLSRCSQGSLTRALGLGSGKSSSHNHHLRDPTSSLDATQDFLHHMHPDVPREPARDIPHGHGHGHGHGHSLVRRAQGGHGHQVVMRDRDSRQHQLVNHHSHSHRSTSLASPSSSSENGSSSASSFPCQSASPGPSPSAMSSPSAGPPRHSAPAAGRQLGADSDRSSSGDYEPPLSTASAAPGHAAPGHAASPSARKRHRRVKSIGDIDSVTVTPV